MFKKVMKWVGYGGLILLVLMILIATLTDPPNCKNIVDDVKNATKQDRVGRFGLEIIELTNIKEEKDLLPASVKIPGKLVFSCSASAFYANGTNAQVNYFFTQGDSKTYTGVERRTN